MALGGYIVERWLRLRGKLFYGAVARKWLCDVLALLACNCAVMGSQSYSQELEQGRWGGRAGIKGGQVEDRGENQPMSRANGVKA